jgi:sulfatase maturation enzyme AslB (radical SAM superfamily)
MKITSLPRKIARGLPYLGKELRAIVSDHTPLFIGKPRVVHIWRGAPCNAKCIMCDYGFRKGDSLRALVQSAFTDDMMPKALAQIAELSGRGTVVSYMGGEPTVLRGLVDWVEQASKLGLDFRFTTNGYTMNEEMARRLAGAGLFNIGVSLESLDPKINEVMRPYPNGTAKTVRAIDLLMQEKDRQRARLSVNVKTVITDINMDSFIEIAGRYGKRDGMMVTPQMFEAVTGMPPETKEKLRITDMGRLERLTAKIRELKADGYNIHVTEQGLSEFLKLYRDDKDGTATMHNKNLVMAEDAPMCNIATDNLWIHNGEVQLCPYHPSIGSMVTATETLKQMWESAMARQVREQTRACRRLCTVSCLRRTPLRHKVSTFLQIA